MDESKWKNILLKIDVTGSGGFVTVAGLRSRQIAFNAESVDVTDAESCGRWRELLSGTGVERAGVSGSGIFKDASTDATIRQAFFDGTIRDWQVIVPDFGTIEGPFQVTALEYAGEHDGELAYEIAMESCGIIKFAAW